MKKNKITVAVISAALVLTSVLCIVPSLAKYITTQGRQSELDSESFYFTSDYLKSDETPVYKVSGESVTFGVRNYADSLRINQSDITYTLTADAGELNIPGGTLTGGTAGSDSITLSYVFSDAEEQKEITVSAISSEPYAEELRAKFILLRPDADLKYEIKDSAGSYYAELYIYTGNTEQTVTLFWDNAELLIDETNDYVFGSITNNPSPSKSTATTGNIGAGTAVKIVFFKKNISADYTCGITASDDGTINVP